MTHGEARNNVGPGWLDPAELRIGLGCMRLPVDKTLARATIAAAVDAGVTVFDTARAYGDNERLLGAALRAERRARIVTKGGMTRMGDAWVADGRAKAIRSDCEASLEALAGLPIDLYLVHAPDPRTPWRTTVRALARLVDEGLVRRVGVSNVNRGQLDEALDLAPISAVQVALSPFDDRALRGGIVERCTDAGIAVIAHSPLGGPRRAGRVDRVEELATAARAHDASAAEVALAWLLALSPVVIPIPGARRPETARSAASAAKLQFDGDELATLGRALGAARPERAQSSAAEVVLVMGIPGAGKTQLAADYTARGYVRLNRDERGGSLREIASALDETLAAGTERLVLDNTYLTRAARSYVVDAARRHGAAVSCVWLDTPLAQAQVNLVERLLERFGTLPTPEELRAAAKEEQGLLLPTSQMRAVRELEAPTVDEGLARVDRFEFVRTTPAGPRRAGVFVAAAALQRDGWREALAAARPDAPHLVFDWRPDGPAADAERLAAVVTGLVESVVCPHPAGPPTCWCRPPLPGLPVAFARAHGIDTTRSVLVGTGPAHRTLATTLGACYVAM